MRLSRAAALAALLAGAPEIALAQESPYFVTYDHHLEEPGNLEISFWSTTGIPRSDQNLYFAPYAEFEYGLTGRWTTELYLEGQSTSGDSTIFTGWRFENRVRPLEREHAVNPVLYLEYEDLNEASRIQKEIVGHASGSEGTNAELRREQDHELEFKLILSSDVHDWNVSENLIAEKNFSQDEGIEFGYALGVSRPLSLRASGKVCRFCLENMAAGLELYGGLGSTESFGLDDTAHYLAPVLSWQVSDNGSLSFSPAFGLTSGSQQVLLRLGYTYEVRGSGRKAPPGDGAGR